MSLSALIIAANEIFSTQFMQTGTEKLITQDWSVFFQAISMNSKDNWKERTNKTQYHPQSANKTQH